MGHYLEAEPTSTKATDVANEMDEELENASGCGFFWATYYRATAWKHESLCAGMRTSVSVDSSSCALRVFRSPGFLPEHHVTLVAFPRPVYRTWRRGGLGYKKIASLLWWDGRKYATNLERI